MATRIAVRTKPATRASTHAQHVRISVTSNLLVWKGKASLRNRTPEHEAGSPVGYSLLRFTGPDIYKRRSVAMLNGTADHIFDPDGRPSGWRGVSWTSISVRVSRNS